MQSLQQTVFQPINSSSLGVYFKPELKLETSCHEKEHLIRSIETLMHSNNELQSKQQNLQNTINDLRRLLKIVRDQSDQQIQIMHEKNTVLAEEAARWSSALQVEHRQGNHLRRCALYWSQFL